MVRSDADRKGAEKIIIIPSSSDTDRGVYANVGDAFRFSSSSPPIRTRNMDTAITIRSEDRFSDLQHYDQEDYCR